MVLVGWYRTLLLTESVSKGLKGNSCPAWLPFRRKFRQLRLSASVQARSAVGRDGPIAAARTQEVNELHAWAD